MKKILIIAFWTFSVSLAVELDAETLHPQASSPSVSPQLVQRDKKEDSDLTSQRLSQPREGRDDAQVYLPNGRVQPVEYITSPVAGPRHPSQQYEIIRNDGPSEVSYGRQGKAGAIKYLELPQEPKETYGVPEPALSYLPYQPSTQRYQLPSQVVNRVEYMEEPAGVALEYIPVQVLGRDFASQYRAVESEFEKPLDPRAQYLGKQEALSSPPQAFLGYQPAHPPLYYTPQIIRILRYAPQQASK